MRKGRNGEKNGKKKRGGKKKKRRMKIVATTSLPAVDRPTTGTPHARAKRKKKVKNGENSGKLAPFASPPLNAAL